jgi:predicted glycoside hydrolase/deacetylase ChbG (UPF0249 family)
VDDLGRFWPLGQFLQRLLMGRIRAGEIEAELRAQYHRFHDLVGRPPRLVNTHHHVQVFAPVGPILCGILDRCRPRPYIRRIREPWPMLLRIPGARRKRLVLSLLGRRNARRQNRDGFPGNDWLAGITDPTWVADPEFFVRWLRQLPGRVVELTCHPGLLDPILIGRDCTASDGMVQRRFREWHLLQRPSFADACRKAGFVLVSAAQWQMIWGQGLRDAA